MKNLKKNGGFTLVELIVVIAILAILAAVAIPAYSGYVTKANMSNDQTLVREVKNALMLQSYSGTGNAGWVILSATGARADEIGAAAMNDTFGANWETAAKLSYDGWTGGIKKEYVDAYIDSSLNGKEEAVLDHLGTLTTDLKDALNAMAGDNFKAFMKDNGVSADDPQSVSNAAVLYAAELASKADSTKATDGFSTYFNSFINKPTDGSVPELTLMGTLTDDAGLGTFGACAAMYAQTEAFCQYIGDQTILDQFHAATAGLDANNTTDEAIAAVTTAMKDAIKAGMTANPGKAKAYITPDDNGKTQGMKDATAFLGIMSAVNDNKGALLGNIGSAGCYSDGSAEGLMNNYINASALAGDVKEGEILVMLNPDGTFYVSAPGAQN